MKPGIYDALTNDEYHSGPGESKSLLDLVRKSPAHYRARQLRAANDEPPKDPTPAQRVGTAFHAMLLEPQEFARNYCLALRPQDVDTSTTGPLVESRDQLVAMVEELNASRLAKLSTSGTKDELLARIVDELHGGDGEAATDLQALKATELKAIISKANEGRSGKLSTSGTMPDLAQLLRDAGRHVTLWADVLGEWTKNNGHRIVLKPEEWEMLHRMHAAVMAHPVASRLITGAPGVAERSVYWEDEETGLLCRCRPDWWRQDGIVVDVKTTEDASLDEFQRSISGWRYYVQDPFYMDGMTAAHQAGHFPEGWAAPKLFLFLAVEKSACVVDGVALGVAVYGLDEESKALGRKEYREDLQTIAECTAAGRFPGYGDKAQIISLPRWKLAQAANEAQASAAA